MKLCHAAWVLVTVATPAAAQQTDPPVGPADSLQPVDQRVEDLNPLSASLRVIPRGLDHPGDFEDVYRVAGHDGFARIQGALYALFPESEYIPVKRGILPVIPSGTTYSIGPPETDPFATGMPSSATSPPSSAMDRRVSHRVGAPIAPGGRMISGWREGGEPTATALRPRTAPIAAPPRRSAAVRITMTDDMDVSTLAPILADPAYREGRLMELLQRAAEAGGAADDQAARGRLSSSSS